MKLSRTEQGSAKKNERREKKDLDFTSRSLFLGFSAAVFSKF